MAITVPRFTIDGLDRFPDDGNRYELLDGMLLVTPAPSVGHEVVVSRILRQLAMALSPEDAIVAARGAVVIPPGTQLEPDILVFSARHARAEGWGEITGHWLAVEVLSPSSRVYDREFKRAAYIALGVREVWLVDRAIRCVEVATAGSVASVTDVLGWRPPTLDIRVSIPLQEIFAGVREDER